MSKEKESQWGPSLEDLLGATKKVLLHSVRILSLLSVCFIKHLPAASWHTYFSPGGLGGGILDF